MAPPPAYNPYQQQAYNATYGQPGIPVPPPVQPPSATCSTCSHTGNPWARGPYLHPLRPVNKYLKKNSSGGSRISQTGVPTPEFEAKTYYTALAENIIIC